VSYSQTGRQLSVRLLCATQGNLVVRAIPADGSARSNSGIGFDAELIGQVTTILRNFFDYPLLHFTLTVTGAGMIVSVGDVACPMNETLTGGGGVEVAGKG